MCRTRSSGRLGRRDNVEVGQVLSSMAGCRAVNTVVMMVRGHAACHTYARRAAVLPLALAADLLLGELPNRFHPVAWIGRLIGRLAVGSPRRPPVPAFMRGTAHTCVVLGLVGAVAVVASRICVRLPPLVGIPLEAVLLKQLFALRALLNAGERVASHLERNDLGGAQMALLSLVSRDRTLPAPLVAAAAVESLAENTCDSVVAPLLAYGVGGLVGASLYRAANTADAMVGYRGDMEYFGKSAARLDDLFNLLPARLTAALFLMVGPMVSGDRTGGFRVLLRDRRRTASPNAGWSMAAVAGLLHVSLEKRGAYHLNQGAPLPDATTIRRTRTLVLGASFAWIAALSLSSLGKGIATSGLSLLVDPGRL